jgi:hypothetical protein
MHFATSDMTTPLSEMKRRHSDEEIDRAIVEVRRELVGAGDQEAARMVTMVAEALQVNVPGRLGMAVYLRILGQLPTDLLHEGTKRVLETHTFNVLPAPAKWREAVKDELEERAAAVSALNRYKGKLRLAELYYPPRQFPALTKQQRRENILRLEGAAGFRLPSPDESCTSAGQDGSSSRQTADRGQRNVTNGPQRRKADTPGGDRLDENCSGDE